MIIEMLVCGKCSKAKADLELNCGHKFCQKCIKQYLFNGFIQKKWEKRSIGCLMANCEQQLPDVALTNCGISQNIISEIQAQQCKFLESSNNIKNCVTSHTFDNISGKNNRNNGDQEDEKKQQVT